MSTHARGNPLKAVSNRTGKREREARSQRKRGWTYGSSRNGTTLPALKLGRKKRWRFHRSTRLDPCFSVSGQDLRYVREKYKIGMAAVPVAETERRGHETVEGQT